MRKDIEILAEDGGTLTLLGDRHVNAPYGVFGGQSGSLATTTLIRDGKDVPLGSKEVVHIQRGDVVSFQLSGAGGYGDPKERPIEAIRADIRNGYLTREFAAKTYGVKLADLS